jgi:predicted DNA-binding transcriptional regulator AlpA
MCIDNSLRRTLSHQAMSADVPLSRWVNEPFPAWNDILTSHEVARLTRRQCWLLNALTFVGKFPKKHHFSGRSVGWLRTDVDEWLGRRCHVRGPCSKVRSRQALSQTSFGRCHRMR